MTGRTPPDPLGENNAQGDFMLAALTGLISFGVVVWVVAGRPFWTAATTHPGYGLRVGGGQTTSEALRAACGCRGRVGR